MDSHASTPAGEASATPRQSRQHFTPSAGTDGERYRLAGRSRVAPPPWWLTREPSRWDQVRLHLRCAYCHGREVGRELWRALHARECTRELYRASYALAGCDLWPRRWWAGVIAAALVLAIGAMLSGCQWIGRTPAPGPVAPTGPATPAATLATAAGAASEARSLAAGASAGRDARLAADVQAAGIALDAVPPRVGDARAAVSVAAGHLSGIAPDAAEAASLASAERSRASGDASGADAAILALTAQARTDAAELVQLRQRAAQAEAQRDAAQAALIRAGEQGAAKLAQALDAERKGVLRGQVAKLSWIGIGCCAAAALAIGAGIALGGVAALRRVGPASIALGVVGLGCLGAAQIIGASWFLPAVGAAGGGAVLWFAGWAYRHQRRGDLAQELATRTGKVAAVARTAVPVLDAAYEEADESVKAWLDEHVFDRLSSAMGKEEKAAVHEVRAEAQVGSGVTG